MLELALNARASLDACESQFVGTWPLLRGVVILDKDELARAPIEGLKQSQPLK